MRRLMMFTACAAVVLTQSGCSYLFGDEGAYRDRSNDYLKSEEAAVITLPQGIKTGVLEEAYRIPVIANTERPGKMAETPRPASLGSSINEDKVRIQSLKGEQWAIIELNPGQVWPRLREFLMSNGITPEFANGVAGVIETPWLLKSEGAVKREKFRFSVLQGVQPSTSEIRVLEWQSGRDSAVSRADWPKTSTVKSREEWMLREFSNFMANVDASESVSLLAQKIDTKGRLKFYRGDDAHILVDLDHNRAWASTAKALKKSGFDVIDLDREKGEFFARYLPAQTEEGKPGFFKRMFGGSDKKDKDDGALYRITVTKSSERAGWSEVRIAVDDASGETVTATELEHMLIDIKAQLS